MQENTISRNTTSNREINTKITKIECEADLYRAILQLKTIEECSSFFHDLCTPAELNAMSERWRVAKLLNEHGYSYREIHEKTGVSLATIGRVARFLTQETYQGYQLVLDRLKNLGE